MADPTDYYASLTYGTGNPFTSAKLKIKRAERHLHELENAARALPRMRACNFAIRKREPGKLGIIFLPQNPMPLEFGGVIGDVIHNIRTAFDHVAVVLTCVPYGTRPMRDRDDVHFPTGKDRDKFIRARDGTLPSAGKKGRKGQMQGARADALRIVEELQPYYGGKNSSIRELHDLDILDKHILVIPTASRLHVEALDFAVGHKAFSLKGTDFQPDADGSNFIATVDIEGLDPEQYRSRHNFDASFTIVFDKGQPFEGEAVVPVLLDLCDVAKSFIKTCEAQILGI